MLRPLALICAVSLLMACSAADDGPQDAGSVSMDAATAQDASAPDAAIVDAGPPVDAGPVLGPIPAEPQREGDPAAGYTALVNAGYVGCGIPLSAYRQAVGPAPAQLRLPGREGANADLAYDFNAFTTVSGVEVVASNCLTCHAALLDGEVVVGLGDSQRDFTFDPGPAAEAVGFLVTDPAERVEWRRWADRIQATAPYIRMSTIGTNPADNLAPILFAHRDPVTLEWFDTPQLDPPTRVPPPVDVPPWWRMKKKNAMFYHGGGRGDHARIMMTASVLCVDTVAEAQSVDAYFDDVRAYISSLEAPAFPNPIDAPKAETGRGLFETHCARCHGSYGDDEAYPNLIIGLEEIGTDPLVAIGAAGVGYDRFRAWFAQSFYGEISSLEPIEGYVAPPLDGVWLTAPYLHNGSVPDLYTLLDSAARPTYWTRNFSSSTYDYDRLGWPWTESAQGHAGTSDPAARARIYDTTLPGHANTGHDFGDALTTEERDAVIEYLRTL